MRASGITSTVFVLIVLICLPTTGSARTWGVPTDALTIQAGIDSASAGDTVLVECGTYYEHGLIMKSGVVLRSETGLADCVRIDAESQGCFTCLGLDSTTVIEGLTIANALVEGEYDNSGAGMYVDSSSFSITNCDFDTCVAGAYGGAIWFYESRLLVTGCNFRGCVAQDGRGGAINLVTSIKTKFSTISLVDCNFEGNSSSKRGGAVNSGLGKLSASGCRFSGNSCTEVGGAVSVSQCDSVVRFTDCVFEGNSSADVGGGAIWAVGCSLEVTGCTLYGNSATVGGGSINIMYLNGRGSLNMDRTIIAFGAQGEPVECVSGPAISITCSDIYGNAAGDWVGCIAGMDGSGGNLSVDPLFCSRETGDYYLRSCSPCLDAPGCGLVGALGAGGCSRVWQVPGDAATIQAGIDSACAGDTVLVASGTYYENLTMKSGIYVIGQAGDPESTVVDANGIGAPVTFIHLAETTSLEGFTVINGLTNYGGGIVCINAAPEIISCRIVNNHANQQGGAILCEMYAAPTFTSCIIAGNTSGNVGGVLASYSSSATTFVNCTMYGNGAPTGGALYVYASSANLLNSIIAFNTSGEAVYCTNGGTATLSCCDVYGNASGDWVGCIAGQAGTNGNFSEDPRFCGGSAGDFHISPCSPCADAPGCGLVGAFGSGGCALTWHVPADEPTIGAALATACAGDTIIVAAGTYHEHDLEMKQGVLLLSETGLASCVTIDADSLGQVMYCGLLDGATVIQGFTFESGYADSGGAMHCQSASPAISSCDFVNCIANDVGGALYCNDSSPQLTDCDFTGNTANDGGGLYSAWNSHPALAGCDFIGNTATAFGGAIRSYDSPVTANDCYFDRNTAYDGGAVWTVIAASDTFTSCVFDSNSATNRGGAVFASGVAAAFIDCEFNFSTAQEDGGGMYLNNSDCFIGSCDFDSCHSLACGGGIYCAGSSPMFDSCTFLDCHADAYGGGGCFFGGSANLYYCDFIGNTGRTTGGGVYCEGSPLIAHGCEFSGNYASGYGGAIFEDGMTAVIDSSVFSGNSSGADGGGVFISDVMASITDCEFSKNSADQGGGLSCTGGAGVTLENCVCDSNSAEDDGGGISLYNCTYSLIDCSLYGNSAGRNGGAILAHDCTYSLAWCSIYGNFAEYGGGICTPPGADRCTYSLTQCTLYNNSAEYGGGIYSPADSATLDHTIIAFCPTGEAYYPVSTGSATFTCCDIYGNAGGDWTGVIAGQVGINGNVSEDPRFCDAPGGDLTLRSDSPCLGRTCGRIGVYGRGCVGTNPAVTEVADVGNDQGRMVRILWERSLFDAPGDTVDITGYEVYQRQDEYLALSESAALEVLGEGYGPEATDPGAPLLAGWDYIGTVPAHGDSLYQYRCPTLCDSTVQDSICWSVFFVRGTTPDPFEYFDSYPDSGYSIDNLAPAPPPGLMMTSPTELAWEEVPDDDFDYYSVYGSALEQLDETAALIGYTIDTAKGVAAHVYDYYHVTATDFSGNEGGESSVNNSYAGIHGLPDVPGGNDIPTTFALRQNRPNPFETVTLVTFDIPEARDVTLRVFDTRGRLVRVLVTRTYEAGRHLAEWDGRDDSGKPAGPGVYFIRMEAGEFEDMKKVMLLR